MGKTESAPQQVPAAVRRRWEAAETEVSNLVFAAPELYERALVLVRQTVDSLRSESADVQSLLQCAEGAMVTVASTAERAGISTAGLRLELIAAAALAMRGREIIEEQVFQERLVRLSHARAEGRGWALIEQVGDPEDALLTPYRRIEVHVASGAALIASVEPDESLGRQLYRVYWAWIDPETGRLHRADERDEPTTEYGDRQAWEEALRAARERLG